MLYKNATALIFNHKDTIGINKEYTTMEIIVNNKAFRTYFQVRRYLTELPNNKTVTITINDGGKRVYQHTFNTTADVKIKCIMLRFWSCEKLVSTNFVYSSQQACELIDNFFNNYGAFNYEISEDYYINGKLINGTFKL